MSRALEQIENHSGCHAKNAYCYPRLPFPHANAENPHKKATLPRGAKLSEKTPNCDVDDARNYEE